MNKGTSCTLVLTMPCSKKLIIFLSIGRLGRLCREKNALRTEKCNQDEKEQNVSQDVHSGACDI